MTKKHQKPYSGLKNTNHKTTTCLIGTVACAAAALPFAASTAKGDDAPSRTDALVNLEFSDHYLTPRGMDVQNHGLVFQPLVLGFFNLYKGDGFFKDVTVDAGVWNCFGTGSLPSSLSTPATTSWYEIDPIAGISFGLPKKFTLGVTYTDFNMQIENIPFSQHLETKLSWDDSDYLGKFALNPYVSWWQELQGKAVASTDASPRSSYYIDAGVSPGYTFKDCGLKIEAPCRVLLPNKEFYGTADPSSTIGLFELGVKASVPLKFMPAGYGHWSFHLGVKYMDFNDANLVATQHRDSATAVYAGLSTFF
jgi:hypothetical protein